MKPPKLFTKLSAFISSRPKKRLQASAARAARRSADDYEAEEPTTKLSSAFIVVLVLHVVAVGGIYAFNSIKASRKEREVAMSASLPATPAPVKPTHAASSTTATAQATHTTASSPHAAEATIPPLNNVNLKPGTGRTYTVKANDSLTKIAFAWAVTPAEIMQANHLKEGSALHPGQTIVIPETKGASKATPDAHKTDTTPKQADVPPTTTTPGFYTVKKGDTATSIAHSFGLTAEELLKANKNTDPKKLQPGQTLKVPPRKS